MGSVSYVTLAHSSILDLTSANTNAEPPTGKLYEGDAVFHVALVLDRANAADSLLEADWGTRQKTLSELEKNGKLWSTYGADPAAYQKVLDALDDLGIPAFHDGHAPVNAQYVSSPESRTIWVELDKDGFATLFGPSARLRQDGGEEPLFWEGDLSLPEAITDAGVKGLWFDEREFDSAYTADPGKGKGVTLEEGPQSIGNSGKVTAPYPNEIAAHYNFPFADAALWNTVETPTVALIEPGVGTSLPGTASATFDQLLEQYRDGAGVTAALKPTITVAPGGQSYDEKAASERSLDVGIVTAIDPKSQLVVYAGSGSAHHADADPFTAYQAAIWDSVNKPAVISSSVRSYGAIAPESPFRFALDQLFVDAVLHRVTVVNSAGDGGSSDEYGNGLTNVTSMHASPYALAVGGTSVSTVKSAASDDTLDTLLQKAMDGHRKTIWKLVKGGLTDVPADAAKSAKFIETVWNDYYVHASDRAGSKGIIGVTLAEEGGYLGNYSSAGGVDTGQAIPRYQIDFGLTPTTTDPRAATGRGVPDVSAASGGNMKYWVPTPDFGTDGDDPAHGDAGTSAAAPLWASLMAQIDAIFADQKLPRLGYMNDLLYTAAVIAPASFNDVTRGDNTSSFLQGGKYEIYDDSTTPTMVKPTGYGYAAGEGYDLVSGLGTPNGTLLARALSTIAHLQMWEDASAGAKQMLSPKKAGGWKSTVKQGFLVQVEDAGEYAVKVKSGNGKVAFHSDGADKFAWTSQFAQQALQSDFDSGLVKMFDGQSQGGLAFVGARAGAGLTVKIDGDGAGTPQGKLSSPFGFVDYVADGGETVRIARPVAVAATVGAEDDQVAVVRFRQASDDKMVLKVYRVDDFKGRIDGLAPGEKGYKTAANDRAYETRSGETAIKGPGYGKYGETLIEGVDLGDIVALKLKQGKHTYWAFAGANEKAGGAHVGHLWNYGVNTWGFESGHKGGDGDYNDLLVQLDFTSAYGHGWLI